MNTLGLSGTSCDFFVWNAAHEIWDGTEFVAWADGDYQQYRIPATEIGTTGRFTAADVEGAVAFDLRLRGATLALSPVVAYEDNLAPASAGLSEGQNEILENIEENVAAMRARQNDQVPEPTPIASIAQPSDPAKATVRIITKDFVGAVKAGVPVTLTLADDKAHSVVIGGAFRLTREFSGVTDDEGVLDLEVWTKDTLQAAKLNPRYNLDMEGTNGVKLLVPHGGGLASDMRN